MLDFGSCFYDPQVGRWFTPDPADQFHNPFLAMGNNPVMYVDPDGEFVHIIIGAVVGGAINLATNWDNIDNFGEGLAAFGAGAASGALTMTLGPGGAALGGAIVGGTNSTIAQTGNGVGLSDVNWGTFAGETVLGAASGFAGGYVGGAVSNGLAAKGIGGVINGAASGFAGGFTGGFVYGSGSAAIRGDGNILQNGFKFGLAGGVGGGIVGGIAGGISTSKDQNIWRSE